MIQFGASSLFIVDSKGEDCSYDLDALRERLATAFRSQGIQELWLLENLVLTIEEKIRSSNENNDRLSEQELEHILMNVLIATGYREVAADYIRLNPGKVDWLPEGGLRSWNAETVQKMLSCSLPLSYHQLEAVTRECLRALWRLGFNEASETFVRELAIHVWHYRKDDEQAKVARTGRISDRTTQFIPADAWMEVASDSERELIQRRILLPLPLSDIFPVARIEFRLENFTSEYGEIGGDFGLITEFSKISSEILRLLGRMRAYIKQNWPRISNPSAHLILPDFQQFFLKTLSGMKRKQRLLLRDQVREAIEKEVMPKTDYELMLSFR